MRMRHSLSIVAGCLAMAAGPAFAAPDASALRDLNCLLMVTQSFNQARQDGKPAEHLGRLQMMSFYFTGKVAARNPGKSASAVIEENKAAMSGSIAKQDPNDCAADITRATAGAAGAEAAAKP